MDGNEGKCKAKSKYSLDIPSGQGSAGLLALEACINHCFQDFLYSQVFGVRLCKTVPPCGSLSVELICS